MDYYCYIKRTNYMDLKYLQRVFSIDERQGKDMDFKVGFVVGFLFVLFFVIIFSASRMKKKGRGEYDERQQLVRGKGYKAGFFTMLICNMLILLLANDDGSMKYINTDVAVMISAFVALIVFAVYCIFNDGYFGVVENPKSTIIGLFLIGVANMIIGFSNSESWVVDGKLSLGVLNFACGATLFIVSFAGTIKLAINKREDE